MITSTTELLNEITSRHVEDPIRGTISHKQSQLSAYDQKRRKEFSLHYACMQSWFLRCSWLEKLDTLTHLLDGLKRIDALSLILNTLSSTCTKTTVYAECQYSTNFVYDKALHDHSRSLHNETYIAVRQADIEWFNALEEDYEQVLIIIGLLRLGGGSVMHQVFERGRKLYNTRTLNAQKASKHSSLIEIKTPSIEASTSGYNLQMLPDERLLSLEATRLSIINTPPGLKIKPENLDELQKRDPKDPFVIEVEKRRKAWNETIRKYRIQVEGKPPASPKKGKGKSDGKSSKSSKKSDKGSKSGKSSKSSKSGKSSKGNKKKKKGQGESEELDQIQLLPIWIVKKIFNYLDAKTLKKIKAVNKYWNYAVTDLQKEQKARKFLDKFISKMEVGIPTYETKTEVNQKPPTLKQTSNRVSNPKKRLQKLWERGAIAPQLRIKLTTPNLNNCLATATAIRATENYFLPVQLMECFPRNWSKNTAPLYKGPSCLVNELGFTWIMDDDDEIDSTDFSTLTVNDSVLLSDQSRICKHSSDVFAGINFTDNSSSC